MRPAQEREELTALAADTSQAVRSTRLVAKSHHDVSCVARVWSRVWRGRVPGNHTQVSQRRRTRRGTAHGSFPQGKAGSAELHSTTVRNLPCRGKRKQTRQTTRLPHAPRTPLCHIHSFIHSFSSVTQHARHAHAQVTRETHQTRCTSSRFSQVRMQRTCLTALRGPPRSLFLLPLTCVGPDTWLPFFLCRRRPLRCGCRLVEGVLSVGARTGYGYASRVTSCFSSSFSPCLSSCLYFFSRKEGAGNPNCQPLSCVFCDDSVRSAQPGPSVDTAPASFYGAFTDYHTFPT